MKEYDIEKTFLTGASYKDNDIVIDAFQSYPDQVVPFVWMNPVEDNIEEKLNHYILKEGFMGIKMQPLFDAFVADDPMVDPIMEFAKEYKIPVFIHCGHPPFSLPWSIGLLAERHPEVKTTMIHMGHGHGVYIEAALNMAKRYDNLYLEMSGMPMGCKIKEAYEQVGKDRIMFGIDSPFHHPVVEIEKVQTCGLDEKALEDVFYNNAAKMIGLK